MSIFKINDQLAEKIEKSGFKSEKELQNFVEQNLEELFGIRFLATEYTTTNGGRIDTLGIDENNAPVIIEYKWGENSTIINQGLFYLDWLFEHFADFQLLVQRKIKKDIEIDRGAPRLVLIATSYSKYDEYAINRMAENIEMWTYNKYLDIFELKLVASTQSKKSNHPEHKKKITKISYDEHTADQHLGRVSQHTKELFKEIQEKIADFSEEGSVEEVIRQMYIAYRTNRNFVYILFRKNKLFFDVCLRPENIHSIDTSHVRDITRIGHHGTGYSRFELSDFSQIDEATKLLQEAYSSTI